MDYSPSVACKDKNDYNNIDRNDNDNDSNDNGNCKDNDNGNDNNDDGNENNTDKQREDNGNNNNGSKDNDNTNDVCFTMFDRILSCFSRICHPKRALEEDCRVRE